MPPLDFFEGSRPCCVDSPVGPDARNSLTPHVVKRVNATLRDYVWELASIERQNRTVGQYHGPLDDVLELANVPGPPIAHQLVHRSLRHRVNPLSKFLRKSFKKEYREFGDVRLAVSQWGHVKWKDIHAVEE